MRALVGVQPSVSIDLDSSLGTFAPVTRCIVNAGLLLSFWTLDKRRLLDARISASSTLTASKAIHHALASLGLNVRVEVNSRLLLVGSD